MNSSQGASAAQTDVRINVDGVAGDAATINKLTDQARRQGVALQAQAPASEPCDVVWQSPGTTPSAPSLTDAPQAGTHQAAVLTLVTGFGPPHHGDGHLPLLRLPDPGIDGSLAELMPPAQGTDALPNVLATSCTAMGYETVVLAGASQGYAVRTANALMIEAMALVGEGVSPETIEASASDAGLRQPPLLMLDQLGLKILDDLLHAALHAQSSGSDHHDHKHHHDHDDHNHDHSHSHDHDHGHGVSTELMPESAVYVLEKMAHGFDRMGAASGYGFYEHEEDGSAELWDGLEAFSRGAKDIPTADIADRLLFSVAIESLTCVREGLLASADADKASIAAGLFPPVHGGISDWITSQSEAKFQARARELADRYGKRFEVGP